MLNPVSQGRYPRRERRLGELRSTVPSFIESLVVGSAPEGAPNDWELWLKESERIVRTNCQRGRLVRSASLKYHIHH